MRVAIDFPDHLLRAVEILAQARRQSRDAIIRQAVDEFTAHHNGDTISAAFGLWGPDGGFPGHAPRKA